MFASSSGEVVCRVVIHVYKQKEVSFGWTDINHVLSPMLTVDEKAINFNLNVVEGNIVLVDHSAFT